MTKENSTNDTSFWGSFFKWVGISFISVMVLSVVLIVILAWKFSPIIKIDDNGIEFFGGSISITETETKKDQKKRTFKYKNKSNHLEHFI